MEITRPENQTSSLQHQQYTSALNNEVSMSIEPSLIDANLDEQIIQLGKEIFQKSENVKTKTFFNKDFWYAKIMDWSMQNEEFKVQMFRFVDVLPTLNSSQEIQKHLNEYFKDIKGEKGTDAASLFNVGLGVGSLAPGLMAKAIKKNIEMMAKMFITGESPAEAIKVLKKNRSQGLAFTVDLLGEATLSEDEAAEYSSRYLELLNSLTAEAECWKLNDVIDVDSSGDIPKVNISVKLTSLYSQINEKSWDQSIDVLVQRLRPIFDAAIQKNAFINIDMESYAHKDLTLAVFKEITELPEYREYPHFGIVLQAYLRDSYDDLKGLIHYAHKRATPFSVRLVKGAYWDYETIKSNQHGWSNPVYTNKKESDANYERCAELLLRNHPHIKVAIASHNVRSISACICMAKKLGLPTNAFEIQMLYGMAEPIKLALISLGFRVREYATVGELIPGMAYLVRRLLENTSNESFLKNKFSDDMDSDILLQNPAKDLHTSSGEYSPVKPFDNCPIIDYALPSSRTNTLTALSNLKAKLPLECPVVINGNPQTKVDSLESINPSNKESLGEVNLASIEDAKAALQSAREFSQTWSQTPATERCEMLHRLGDLITRDRYNFMALATLEAGKTWVEADNEVVEAIDFCHFYASEMKRISQPQKVGHIMGETSHYAYFAKGVSVVIAPWNFPFAILAGMATASLVTGNTIIMKPAEQTSLIAYELYKLMMEAGFPPAAVQFLPGRGELVGDYLTSQKDVDIIVFTGSKPVGLEILKKSSQIQEGQISIKKCILEMGGKNGLIIDNDADLDEAIGGVVYSAFGFQGQKCSAASRVIVLDEIYDRFMERLISATKSIKQLPADNPEAYLSAVIDEEAFTRINGFIERGKTEATLAYQGEAPANGYYVGPTIFTDVKPNSELAQAEIFGPVLSVIKVKDINEAIEVINSTEYALTGGLFSRSPGNIEKAKQQIEVGNLYINRTITGAIVQRQPFGGFKMSGIGSKAGGPDYLLQFVDPRVVTENTMRRGFAPIED